MKSDHLTLVDWRRRVADLYARVREAPDPADGHALWIAGRTELFATHPQSPTSAWSDQGGVEYWPYDPRWRFVVRLLDAEPAEILAPGGDDGTVTLRRTGRVELPDLGSLDVWWLDQYAGGVFVPLKDATSGSSTYGGGRYVLDTIKGAWLNPDGVGELGGDDSTLTIDLNFAYHPSCRYDARWICPLAPPGNTLDVAVEAGERL